VTFRVPDYGLENCTLSFAAFFPPTPQGSVDVLAPVNAENIHENVRATATRILHLTRFAACTLLCEEGIYSRGLHAFYNDCSRTSRSRAGRASCGRDSECSRASRISWRARSEAVERDERQRHHTAFLLQEPISGRSFSDVRGALSMAVWAARDDARYIQCRVTGENWVSHDTMGKTGLYLK
jgi:hypothetical protein